MSVSAVQRFYRFHARVYDSTRWMILHGRRRAVARLKLRSDSHVLEVGCGTGLNFGHLQAALDPEAGRITGLDFSPDMLDRAARRVRARGWGNVRLVAGDATRMQLGETFDAVFFGYSLTMIPDWEAALARAAAHLVPGGMLVILDFGQFRQWGPLGPVLRSWLRANHVDTRPAYVEGLRRVFRNVSVEHWLGGYNFIAAARRGS